MSALVDRIIVARDQLAWILRSTGEDRTVLTSARDAMADAANAITERDETIHYQRQRIALLKSTLDELSDHARPSNWDDDDDPEQVAAWNRADTLRSQIGGS